MAALSFVPCICEDNCANATAEQSTTNHKKQNDNCAPFCNCACCHSVVNNLKPALFIGGISGFPEKMNFVLANQNFTTYNCDNIWQPPRLS